MTMQEALDSQGHDEPAKATVCSTCNDTHMMPFRGEEAMCTRCPVPCQKCRVGGNGPYCTTTPCGCACHGEKPAKVARSREARRRNQEQANTMTDNDNEIKTTTPGQVFYEAFLASMQKTWSKDIHALKWSEMTVDDRQHYEAGAEAVRADILDAFAPGESP